jgi:hypothetical protein
VEQITVALRRTNTEVAVLDYMIVFLQMFAASSGSL